MEKDSLPPTEPQSPSPDLAQTKDIQDALNSLARSLTVLGNGIRAFAQLDPSEASNGFNLARNELENFRDAVVATRSRLSKLLQMIGQDIPAESLSATTFPKNRNPNSPVWVASRLISGVVGCKNTIKTLLKQDQELLKKEMIGNSFGQKNIDRLVTLSTTLKEVEFGTPEEAKKAVRTLQEKMVSPSKDFAGPNTKNRSIVSIDPEKARSILDQLDQEKSVFQTELRYKIARKIMEQIANKGEDFLFQELRKCFDGVNNIQLKKELEALRQEIKHFNLILVGSFEPWGRPLITLKIPHLPNPSIQSSK